MVVHNEITAVSDGRCGWIDITPDIQSAVRESGIAQGVCCIASLHTTAGITINENADPDVRIDFFRSLSGLVPQKGAFRHREGNSDSHILASLVGLSALVPITNGMLTLGTWQSVYLCEFDGPRTRRVTLTIIGESGGNGGEET